MALLESLSIPLGTTMPYFDLKDASGARYSAARLMGTQGLLVIFTCNHCPYAKAVWPRLIKLARYGMELGISSVAINPNIHPDYPEDAPEKMGESIQKYQIFFPYLIDDTQDIAKKFQAQCTPDIYLFNKDQGLVYHGRIDDNWQDPSKVTREDLKAAMEQLASGKKISQDQKPSMGCSIKWKKT